MKSFTVKDIHNISSMLTFLAVALLFGVRAILALSSLREGLLRNGNCVLIGIGASNSNTTIAGLNDLLLDQVMVWMESPYEVPEQVFIQVSWSNFLFSRIALYNWSFHQFIQGSTKMAGTVQCAISMLGIWPLLIDIAYSVRTTNSPLTI